MPPVSTNDLKNGMTLVPDNNLMQVVEFQHVKPGKGHAFVRSKLKNVRTGAVVENTFRAGESVERANIDKREMQYLYADGEGYVFMDNENFDQVTLSEELAGESMKFLRPNTSCTVLVHEGTPLIIELPAAVELEVTDTPPGVKSATVTNVFKEATCETGLLTKVPNFINNGDTIRVSTADGSYQARV